MTRAIQTEMRILRTELLDAHRELVRLRTQTEQLMASNRELSALLASTAQRNGELLKIIVAFRRLLESPDAGTALRSIEEILINVIGTEDFVVLLITDEAPLRAVAGMGPAVTRAHGNPPTLDDLRGSDARVVPLYIADNMVGAIVIEQLLPHRDSLNASDDQVLSLLARFGASAVMTAEHRQSWTRLAIAELS